MSEIKCPHCGKMFKIDDDAFASLANQVRDEEFHRELEERGKAIIAQEIIFMIGTAIRNRL